MQFLFELYHCLTLQICNTSSWAICLNSNDDCAATRRTLLISDSRMKTTQFIILLFVHFNCTQLTAHSTELLLRVVQALYSETFLKRTRRGFSCAVRQLFGQRNWARTHARSRCVLAWDLTRCRTWSTSVTESSFGAAPFQSNAKALLLLSGFGGIPFLTVEGEVWFWSQATTDNSFCRCMTGVACLTTWFDIRTFDSSKSASKLVRYIWRNELREMSLNCLCSTRTENNLTKNRPRSSVIDIPVIHAAGSTRHSVHKKRSLIQLSVISSYHLYGWSKWLRHLTVTVLIWQHCALVIYSMLAYSIAWCDLNVYPVSYRCPFETDT